jgi:predicted amidohydrolase YtcJ
MNHHRALTRASRREFMGLAAGTVAATAFGSAWFSRAVAAVEAAQAGNADLIVVNANVYTVDSRMAKAAAFAVKNSRLIAVGTNDEITGLVGKDTRTIDAKQMTVVPGFTDCHNHAGGDVLLYEALVGNPFEVEFVTIASIVETLRAKAKQTPAGTWVEGYFFDDTKVKDKRQLNVRDLDEVSRDHPVVVRHRGGHTSYYNSKALAMAGVTKDTRNPAGGTYDRDDHGELTGRVTDTARAVIEKVGNRPTLTPAERERRGRDGIAHISKQFARYGLTSVHHQGGDLAAIQDVRARGELRHRVSYEVSGRVLDSMIASGIQTGFGDEWIKLGATSEHTLDGSFSERTMALSQPYPGTTSGYKGNVTDTPEELNAWLERVHRAGIQVNCHANGDVAIEMFLSAVERVQQRFPRADARPKITHCTLINDSLVKRIKALDAIPALFTTYAYYNSDKFVFYGEEFMTRAMAFRSLLDAGVHAAAGSDFSPGPFAPLMGIQGMATRKGWDGKIWGANQKISVADAIRVNTLHGAYASKEENLKGSITPGKLADFVVLSEDPHTIDLEKIKDIKIARTVVGGNTVYEA